MASYKQGDIVSIPFPFSDNPASSKLRPALIISNNLSNSVDSDLIFLPITSQIRSDIFSFNLDNNFLQRPLPKNCEVRCNKIFTLRDHLITKKVSEIDPKQLKKILELAIKAFI